MANNLIRHLEAHLGTISRGWGDAGDIQVVEFLEQPRAGVVTYATVGLSRVVLPMPRGRTVRQELLISVYASYDPSLVASVLISFAEYVRRKKMALLRGDVVGPSAPLYPGAAARALYAAMPVFFDEDFATYAGTRPPTVLVWLIPLPPEDADFVRTRGWEAFEDRLEATDVVFWDLNRPPLG